MSGSGWSGEHPEQFLSDVAADVPGDDVDAARSHVVDCDRCRAIVEDERAVRGVLGGLPEVAPPSGFFTDLLRRRRRQALAVCGAGLVAAAVAWALLMGGESGVVGEVRPEVAELRDRHMEGAERGHRFAEMDSASDMPAPYQEPDLLAGRFERVARFDRSDGTMQVTYRDGATALSLFEQAGHLDPTALPDDMTPMALGDGAWELAGSPVRVVVVRRGDLVYTLVSDVSRPVLLAAVDDLPPQRQLGLDRRITAALDDLLRDFSLNL